MTIEHIPDHIEQARADLLSQYRGKPRIEALIKSLCGDSGVQQLEDELDYARTLQILEEVPLFTHPDLSAADNDLLREHKLEQWGRLVGVDKGELTEEEFVRFIKARIQANYSEVRREELAHIYALLTDADAVYYADHHPAGYELTAFVSAPMRAELRERVDEMLEDIRPGGVIHSLVEGPPPDQAFRFGVAGQGFNEGKLTRVI